MKTVLALALACFAACATDMTSSGSQNDQGSSTAGGQGSGSNQPPPNIICHTNADCPPNYYCYIQQQPQPTTTGSGVCVSTTPPPPPQCTSDAQCPQGERCNPICSTTGTIGHQCQPDGLPTAQCPTPCQIDSQCTAGDLCRAVCNQAGTTTGFICASPTATTGCH